MSWDRIISQDAKCNYCSGFQVGLSNCLATKNPKLTKEWHPTKNGNLTPYDITCGSNKEVWWQCEKNNKHEWKTTINNRNRGKNCPYCSGNYPSKDYNLLIINPELSKEWDYSKNKKNPEEYTPGSNKKVWWKCKKCGNEWKAVISNRNKGIGCPICNESKGEQEIRCILKNKNIKFDPQYTFSDLLSDRGNPLRFDFGVLNKNNELMYLIEYDGEGHYSKETFGEESYKLTIYHDQLKNQYCQKNNIPLLRIPYWDFDNIENILEEYINKLNII